MLAFSVPFLPGWGRAKQFFWETLNLRKKQKGTPHNELHINAEEEEEEEERRREKEETYYTGYKKKTEIVINVR